ncbi:MAG: transcription termination/antitermination NusG family protein [Pelolinea sp.]|nr:transcription termination/antitermination NusG family protein [Pelolinea sp.]
MTKNWYTLYTKPHKENFVARQLCELKIESFFPTINVNPVNPRSQKIKPYFPRYLFIHADNEKIGEPEIKWMPGIIRMISFDHKIAVVPDQIIQLIRQRVEEINATDNETSGQYKKGDAVIVREGPFAGYGGIFDLTLSGQKRVRILLELLHDQFKRLELPAEQIQRKTRR